jgi:cellulose synthase/poly-beta-1,6-N-acetylglucosamine synthase-like glycosyltransferase
VAGPVQFYAGSSAWSRILALEFMGLSALAAGSIAQGRPFSCSGGSVGIRRSVYDAVGGYTGLEHLSSGDDEMLMHRVNKRPDWEVGYCTDRTAVVWTTSPLSAPELLMQRRRWASKAIHYEALSIRIGFLSGLLFACMLIVLSLAGFYNALYWWILAVMMCVKVLSEMSLLVVASRVFHRSGLLVYHLFVQPVHIFYVCWTGIMGLFGNYEWKGRKLLR